MITAVGVTGHFMFMSVRVTALMAMRMLVIVIVIVMMGGGLGSLFPLNAFMAKLLGVPRILLVRQTTPHQQGTNGVPMGYPWGTRGVTVG
jgi:hypothetical protein